jgi:ferredoxin
LFSEKDRRALSWAVCPFLLQGFSRGSMVHSHTVRIHNRQKDTYHSVNVPEDRYILATAEMQGVELPFSCRNGACTTCAVRVLSGEIDQPEAMGLSPKLRESGYALLCVSYPRSDIEVETQDEDEVYELQFGRYFGKGKVRRGLPLDED